MRTRRAALAGQNPTPDLQHYFEDQIPDAFSSSIIAGFAPTGDEIDIWPLLKALHRTGRNIGLPVIQGPDQPLLFREWTPGCNMQADRYGISFPAGGRTLTPQLVFVPLLAFTARGNRLGYGGGYYDRTLEALRRRSKVFACGVAFAGQEVEHLPTDKHDEKLDGILTETGFKAFA